MRYPRVTAVCLFGLLLTACVGREQRAIGVYHHVRPGQTLFRIAKTYGVGVAELGRVNRIADPADIEVGDRLFIPGARRVLEVPSFRSEETAMLERQLPARDTTPARVQFAWPVQGKIIARFGVENELKNNGIAIAVPQGTPVRAAERGKVIYSGADLRDYGNLIVIDHDGGFATVYAHNQVNLVKRGERVGRGQVIAKVGMTGIAETPYVHFEIRQNAKAKDPLAFLE